MAGIMEDLEFVPEVTLVDNRVLHGDLQCLDKQGNLVLTNAAESMVSTAGKPEERALGMILVPLAQRKEVELQVTTVEKLSVLKLADV